MVQMAHHMTDVTLLWESLSCIQKSTFNANIAVWILLISITFLDQILSRSVTFSAVIYMQLWEISINDRFNVVVCIIQMYSWPKLRFNTLWFGERYRAIPHMSLTLVTTFQRIFQWTPGICMDLNVFKTRPRKIIYVQRYVIYFIVYK